MVMRSSCGFFITALLGASLGHAQNPSTSREPDVPYVPTTETAVKGASEAY
jgi:hypothetical protein